jgi:hypothetical protein
VESAALLLLVDFELIFVIISTFLSLFKQKGENAKGNDYGKRGSPGGYGEPGYGSD